MANKDSSPEGMSLPVVNMLLMGILGAVLVAVQVEVVKYWPQPASIVPPFGWDVGAVWGLIVGGLVGLFTGFITDESHYPDQKES